jgi:hypothetical protein
MTTEAAISCLNVLYILDIYNKSIVSGMSYTVN